MEHPTDRDLKGLLEERLAPKARRRVVRHLLSRCADCPARMRELLPSEWLWTTSLPASEAAYDASIDRAATAAGRIADVLDKERERRDQGIALVREKGWASLTSSERRRFCGRWAQVEMLLALSFEMRFRSRQTMLQLALSAQRTADRLTPSAVHGTSLLFDLRARAAAEVANAERVSERFFRTQEEIKKARCLLSQGTGDLMVEARIDEVEASLLKDERRLEQAEVLLGRAQLKYLRLGQHHLAGRVLVTKGLSRRLEGRPAEASEILRSAISLIDGSRDPQLLAVAQHDLLHALADAGEFSAARRLLLESGLRQRFAGEPLNLMRVRWVEGKILFGRGMHREAEKVFRAVRDAFREQGVEFVAAVAGLDVARVALQQGRILDAVEIARELTERAGRKLPPKARQALFHFQYLCELEVATAVNAHYAQRLLLQLEKWPTLEWEVSLLISGR